MVSYFLMLKKGVDSLVTTPWSLTNKMNEHFGIFGMERLNWFNSYLTNREQHQSSKKMIICGLSHGSILGLLLFLLYSNDFPDSLTLTSPCICMRMTYKSSLIPTMLTNLSWSLILIFIKYESDWLQIHPSKSKVLFIGSSLNLNNMISEQPIVINNHYNTTTVHEYR